MRTYTCQSLLDTEEVATALAGKVLPSDCILLIGPMGAGKTAFSKAFAKGLGIKSLVNSPTFTLLNIYDDGRIPMYHFDCYRIEDADEIYAIGFEDYLYGDGVCVIEWPEVIKDILPSETIKVKIDVLPDGKRRIEVTDNRKDCHG